ncbi:sensor histidine kinase [Planomonospora corallina]|uniref:histidine kinase n=1 Tax=Planomonospora corallina TaxID=1806052 RepID=A0ABV8I375_9ACTN
MRVAGARKVWRFLRRPRVVDGLLVALVLTLEVSAALAVMFPSGHPDRVLGTAVVGAGALPLILRRSHPVAAVLIVLPVDALNTLLTLSEPGTLSSTVALYSVGRHAPGRRAWTAAGASVPLYTLLYLTVLSKEPAYFIAPVLFPLIFTGVGQFFRLRSELHARRRQQAADGAVRAERRRIARELHDVVAHHITTINVLVGAGRTTMASDPARAQEALVTAERMGREAMAEMRQLLHVLRLEDGDESDDHSGTTAAALPALVEQARASGLPAELEVAGHAVPLPAAVDHAVYRIVQEALTNTRKHAAGARASVRLAYLPGAVEVEVLDDGLGGRPGQERSGGGFGLGGMAERVALCGGQLHTGPRPSGGFRVHARIPASAGPDPASPKESK